MNNSDCYDKNGVKICEGQYAIVSDRVKHKWVGKIKILKPKFIGEFLSNGKPLDEVYVFSSNMKVWLSNWTEKSLEIIKPTFLVKIKYQIEKRLPWGFFYSKKIKDNYYL